MKLTILLKLNKALNKDYKSTTTKNHSNTYKAFLTSPQPINQIPILCPPKLQQQTNSQRSTKNQNIMPVKQLIQPSLTLTCQKAIKALHLNKSS